MKTIYPEDNQVNARILTICLLAVGAFYASAYTVSRFSEVSPDQLSRDVNDANAERVASGPARADRNTTASVRAELRPGVSLAHKIQLAVLRTAIADVESGGDPKAIGDNGEAVGILQIHRITVDDVNRILGKDQYTYADRLDPIKSAEMFDISSTHYANHYNDWTAEGIARRWNGGGRGHLKKATEKYWEKVKCRLEKSN